MSSKIPCHALLVPSLLAAALLGIAGPVAAQSSCILLDINPGSVNSLPARFVDVNGVTFFSASSPGSGHALWKTDGTTLGTWEVMDFYPGTGGGVQPRELVDLNGLCICYADDGVHGAELWRSDGTYNGTWMIKNINPWNEGSPVYMDPPVNLTVWKNRLYFSARDANHGRELWVSDGTAAGTVLLKDIEPGGMYSDSYPSFFTPVGDRLFFFAFTSVSGYELWKTDGTTAGTVMVRDIWPGPEQTLMTHNNYQFVVGVLDQVLFLAMIDGVNGFELWKSDGTATGTVLVKDITPGPGDSYFNRNFTQAGGWLYFCASDGQAGKELWKTDGTAAGTVLVKDIYPGPADSWPGEMAAFGNRVVFGADDGQAGYELWVSDGSAAGTNLLRDILPGGADSMTYSRFYAVGSRFAYFTADDGSVGSELWRTDGTLAGTTLVQDIRVGYSSSYPEYMTLSNGNLIFRASDSIHGQEPRVFFPGATAQARGTGYPIGNVTARLDGTDPVLGQTALVTGLARTAGQPVFLLAGLPGAPLTILPLFFFYLDVSKPVLLAGHFTPGPTADWSLSFLVPAAPALAGAPVALQALQVTSSSPVGFDASNCLVMTPGP